MNRFRPIEILAELKIWFGVGQGYFYDLRYPVLLAIALKVYLPTASIGLLAWITAFIVVFFVILGKIDLRYIRLHQTANEISTEKYNPYFKKLKEKI